MERFSAGAQVKFCYKNSCYQTVRAYGTVVKYENRYYYIRTALDMVHRIYCSKVHPLQVSKVDLKPAKDFTEPSKQSNVQIIKETLISDQLKQLQQDMDSVVKVCLFAAIANGLVLSLICFSALKEWLL